LAGPSGKFWISGKIRNNGEVELFNAQVRLTVFDRFGKVLEFKNTPHIAKIDPGTTVDFNLIKLEILKENVYSYNLTASADKTPY
jgi:hypothetical protein